MKRYDVEHTVWGDLSIVERAEGDWVKWDDVAKLEESHAELLALLKRTDGIIANATNAVYWKQIFELRGEITDVISKAELIQ